MNKTLLMLFALLHSLCVVAQSNVIIQQVSVLSMENDQVLKNQDVWITNGIIKKIMPHQKTPKNALLIDGKGKFLMPSMADMHAHIPTGGDNALSINQFLNLHLAAGVTTLRSMRGDYSHLALRDSIRKGLKIAPNLYLSAPPVNRYMKVPIDSIAPLIARYKQAGFDFIKILSIPAQNFYETLRKEADKQGLKVVGHVPMLGLRYALDQRQYCLEHLQGYPNYYTEGLSKELSQLIDQTNQAGIYNCPTLDWTFVGSSSKPYTLAQLKNRNGMAYIPENLKANWEKTLVDYLGKVKPDEVTGDSLQIIALRAVMKEMKTKKAKMLISPDASSVFQVPGFGLLEEMKLFREAGYSNYEIVTMVTRTPAEYFGEATKWGLVKEDYQANLVLLGANPLDNIENISKVEGILLNGKYLQKSYLIDQLKSK